MDSENEWKHWVPSLPADIPTLEERTEPNTLPGPCKAFFSFFPSRLETESLAVYPSLQLLVLLPQPSLSARVTAMCYHTWLKLYLHVCLSATGVCGLWFISSCELPDGCQQQNWNPREEQQAVTAELFGAASFGF